MTERLAASFQLLRKPKSKNCRNSTINDVGVSMNKSIIK